MKDMPLGAVLGSIVFFYHLGKELSMHTLTSLGKQEMETYLQHPTFQENGDGINQFMGSLTGILRDLKISLN
jgi:hypothetical protein